MNPNDLYITTNTRSGFIVWTLKELRELGCGVLTIHGSRPQKGSCRCVVNPFGFGTPAVPLKGFTCEADASHAYIL